MGDRRGKEFNFGVEYSVVDNTATVSNTSMSPVPSGDDTGIDAEGNITMDKKDWGWTLFSCVTDGWSIAELQIRDHGKDWGDELSDKAQKCFPDANTENGTVPADPDGLHILSDTNKKNVTVDYRLKLTDGTTSIWSDPRVRDKGR